MFEYAM